MVRQNWFSLLRLLFPFSGVVFGAFSILFSERRKNISMVDDDGDPTPKVKQLSQKVDICLVLFPRAMLCYVG